MSLERFKETERNNEVKCKYRTTIYRESELRREFSRLDRMNYYNLVRNISLLQHDLKQGKLRLITTVLSSTEPVDELDFETSTVDLCFEKL